MDSRIASEVRVEATPRRRRLGETRIADARHRPRAHRIRSTWLVEKSSGIARLSGGRV